MMLFFLQVESFEAANGGNGRCCQVVAGGAV
jgi:hypothetical protein